MERNWDPTGAAMQSGELVRMEVNTTAHTYGMATQLERGTRDGPPPFCRLHFLEGGCAEEGV